MRCCQCGDVLKLGVVSGYSRRRHVRSGASVGGSCDDGCDGERYAGIRVKSNQEIETHTGLSACVFFK